MVVSEYAFTRNILKLLPGTEEGAGLGWGAATPQAHLVTGRETGQVRQNLQNIHTAEPAVLVVDELVGLVLGEHHHCSSSTGGSGCAQGDGSGRCGNDWAGKQSLKKKAV